MRATGSTLAAVGFAALMAGCAGKPDRPTVGPEADDSPALAGKPSVAAKRRKASTADVAATVEGNNAFAFDLYAKLRANEGNIVFSPYSISTALAMTYAGARGETAGQMAAVLRFPAEELHVSTAEGPHESRMIPIGQERIAAAFAHLVDDLNSRGGDGDERSAYELVVANRLWGQRGYPFLDPFLALNRTYYGAGLEQVDFVRATEAARRTINAWVEDKTRDKIKELLKPGILTPEVRLVLTNAIYFKGSWASRFKKEHTKDAPFSVSPANRITVPTMRQTERFGYAEAEGLQVLELPYVGDELSMAILLPKKTHGLAEIEALLDAGSMKTWLSRLAKRKVQVFLPRFKIESGLDLKKALKSMGMPLAFDDRKAD
ncbi:MAG: serpin family protein, partial [Planctomycetota bacterium]